MQIGFPTFILRRVNNLIIFKSHAAIMFPAQSLESHSISLRQVNFDNFDNFDNEIERSSRIKCTFNGKNKTIEVWELNEDDDIRWDYNIKVSQFLMG